jgi:hypothetical protein
MESANIKGLLQSALASEKFSWWLPMIVIGTIAAVFRLAFVGNHLPVDAGIGTDESYYYLWARAIRDHGRPDVEHGTGYPPGFLYLLVGEQILTEIVRGESLNPAVDYFFTARFINGIFGVINVLLIGILARKCSDARLVGLYAALIATFSDQMIQESRRAAANSLWLFFTLLTFKLLLGARDKRNLWVIYLAMASGLAAFLFKYHSGVILILPLAYAFTYFRRTEHRLPQHFVIWAVLLGALLMWLVLDYRIFEIANTPSTDADSYISNGQLVGLQSLSANIRIISQASGAAFYLWGTLIAFLITLVSFVSNRASLFIQDKGAVAAFLIFSALFYILMSFFRPTDPEKWLVIVAVTYILTPAAVFSLAKSIESFWSLVQPPFRPIAQAIPMATMLVFIIGIAAVSLPKWNKLNDWAKPHTLNLLDAWFRQNALQGGRIAVESVKAVYNYSHSPGHVHNHVVDSIFSEAVGDYQMRGYEYLVWNNLKSAQADSLADLDARQGVLISQGAKEVLRLTGATGTGPDIVVFQIPPSQQHPLYTWFSPAISFRGYDLNKDTFQPGEEVQLMLYWMSAEPTAANYIVFVHVLDPATGTLVVGQDGPPDYGNTPTWQWQGDMQFIRDQHILTIPDDAQPGKYVLRIGMYDADTKARLPIFDLQNQPLGDTVTLQEIQIQK